MKIEQVVLRLVEMPLKFRFRTSFGETAAKRFLLVEVRSAEATDGLMPVPAGPGIGVDVRSGVLARFTLAAQELRA